MFKRKRPDLTQARHMVQGQSTIDIGRFTYGTDAMEVREWGEGANLRIGSFCSIGVGLTVMLGGNHRTDWATTFPFGHIFPEELGGTEITGHPPDPGRCGHWPRRLDR